MQLENFIQFIIRHNALIIQSLVGLIVLSVLFMAYRSFLAAKDAELHPESGGLQLGQLEETLKKLLEKANQVPVAGSSAAAAAGPESAQLIEEIAQLKMNLESKQSEIENLKTATPGEAAPAGGAGLSADEKAALDAQIKELQAKLAEYEIISEDIADLSFYKDENAKLQKQLESLKVTGATAAPAIAAGTEPAAPEAPAVAAAPKPPPPTPAPSAAALAAKAAAEAEAAGAAPAPAPAATPAAVPAPAAPVEDPMAPELSELTPVPQPAAKTDAVANDDIMKEFETAVAEQAAASHAPEPVAAAPAPTAVEPAPAAAEETIDLGTMDLDKMVAEADVLDAVKVDDAAAAAGLLETGPDAEKLLAEAASMAPPVKTEDAQLMGQFENFVKKGGA